jgi:type III secretion protein V
MGLPLSPVCSLDTQHAEEQFAVLVNGRRITAPQVLAARIQDYVYHEIDTTGLAWSLEEFLSRASEAAVRDPQAEWLKQLSTFFAELIYWTVARRPEELLCDTCVTRVVAGSAGYPELDDNTLLTLHKCFRRLLRLGISLAAVREIGEAICTSNGGKEPELLEDELIARLRPRKIRIAYHPSLVTDLAASSDDEVKSDKAGTELQDDLAFLREGLFHELGLRVPAFEFEEDENLLDHSFSVAATHVSGVPLRAVRSGQVLVNDTSDRLALMDIKARPAINPATDQPAAVVEGTAILDPLFTTWTPAGFLVLAAADEVRRRAPALVNAELLEYELAVLSDAFPEVVSAAADMIPTPALAKMMRELVEERIPLTPLPQILNLLSIYESHRRRTAPGFAGRAEYLARMTDLRTGLRMQIKRVFARNNLLVVYLLESDVEERLRTAGSAELVSDEESERICAAVRREIGHLPRTAAIPHILTHSDVRPILRDILASEFPRMSFFGYTELAPDLNIQPIARIRVA